MADANLLRRLIATAPRTRGAKPVAPATDQQIIVDPAEAARQSARRRRQINVVTYPVVRAVGFQLMILVMLGHNLLVLPEFAWQPVIVYAVAVEFYCVLSWWALVVWFDRVKALDLGLLFLTTDLFFWTGAVYVSGGYISWLFFLLALRVADQSFVNFRRAAAFAHLAPLFYLAMLIWQHQVDLVPVDWGRGLALTLLIYLSSLYLLMSGLNAEKLRDRSAAAVRLARDSIQQLQERSTQLARAKEAAEAASVAKSQFLANMSHELKTPLNAVIGYSEMLIEDPDLDSETRSADLAKIRTAGQHLLGLINEVLELARLETGKANLALEDIHVPTLVQDAATSLQAQATKTRNTLDLHCAPGVGRMVADPAKLRQILLTLLGNGLKFTEGGRVQLQVQPSEDGQDLLFRVSDTGIGMSQEQQARLFQPFMQADGSSTRKHGGAALGLTLTQRYCEMMGGRLEVRSTPGAGTVFTATLPLSPATPPTEPAA
ncbi:MAG TPA: HAMP domain-containing sensor histidine kinase [Ramlibacter sp.]|nr:HAMP domain-containing sensor histidine kinase [Ramlibacter sp.]